MDNERSTSCRITWREHILWVVYISICGQRGKSDALEQDSLLDLEIPVPGGWKDVRDVIHTKLSISI